MEKIAITFRDFTAHLIPGLMYFLAFFLMFPKYLALIEGREIIISIAALFSAYAVGFLADTIFFPKFNKIIRAIPFFFKDPMVTYFSKVREKTYEKKTLKFMAYKLLKEHFGDETIENTKDTTLIYLCIRYVESQNTLAANSLMRINSLSNLSVAMVPPLLTIGIVSIFQQVYWVVPLVLTISFFSLRKNLFYRLWLAKSAIRHYSILRLNCLEDNKAS